MAGHDLANIRSKLFAPANRGSGSSARGVGCRMAHVESMPGQPAIGEPVLAASIAQQLVGTCWSTFTQ